MDIVIAIILFSIGRGIVFVIVLMLGILLLFAIEQAETWLAKKKPDHQEMVIMKEGALRASDQVIKQTQEEIDDFGAFKKRFQFSPVIERPIPHNYPYNVGSFNFAVYDSFDIQGYITGFGNPDWERTHEPATQTSVVVADLINKGARLIGKTVGSDMALSITGENCHYGTPTNPAAPELIPGGVSSGASVAAAAKLADFSLGVDTDGGVRVAAGYCGACGFRPSHGIVSLSGVIPVSKSLDTVGWFAKNTQVLKYVGNVVLHVIEEPELTFPTFFIADDCFSLAKFPLTNFVIHTMEGTYPSYDLERVDLGEYLCRNVPSLKLLHLKESGGDRLSSHPITVLAYAMQKLKRYEFMQNHSEWIDSVKPKLDPSCWRQVSQTRVLPDLEVENCYKIRSEMWSRFLKGDGILVIPTCIIPPSELGAKETLSEDYLIMRSALSSLASMSGCCEVVIPVGVYENTPFSVSLLARHGADTLLLDAASNFYVMLQQQVREVTKCKEPIEFSSCGAQIFASLANGNGDIAFSSKNWQKAVDCHTEAIKLNGSIAIYYNDRAAAYFEMQSYAQAEADCTIAIELDKNSKPVNRTESVEAYLLRGTIRNLLHNYNGAKEDFGRALSLDPTNDEAYEALNRMC